MTGTIKIRKNIYNKLNKSLNNFHLNVKSFDQTADSLIFFLNILLSVHLFEIHYIRNSVPLMRQCSHPLK
jgi:hypothetical protein